MRCFSILGPSGSGKSTLADRIAALGENAKNLYASADVGLRSFQFMEEPWFCIDAPGSNEALVYSINALLVSDIAIICVSADPEQAVLAAPYIRATETSGTPSILFINRIDEPRGRIQDVVASLQEYADHALVLRQIPMREDGKVVGAIDLISERAWRYKEGEQSSLVEIPVDAIDREHTAHDGLLEQLSEYDDWLLEELIEDRKPASEAVFPIAARVVKESRITPVLLGSASHSNGIMRLMKALRHEAPDHAALRRRLSSTQNDLNPSSFCATFNAYYKPGVGKITVVRCLSGKVTQGAKLGGHTIGAILDPITERQISSKEIKEGELFSAIKSEHLKAPALYDIENLVEPPVWAKAPEPMFDHLISTQNERDDAKLSDALKRLQECDPGVRISQLESAGGLVLSVQGPLHLRQAMEVVSNVFKVPVTETETRPVYKETISTGADVHYRHRKQSGGAGQFADVKLSVCPNTRGQGFEFSEVVKGGSVPRNYIPAVEAGARDAMEKGPLGFGVIDVKVVLNDGQHHSVDSSDLAFRTAGMMGAQKALGEANPVLMQPIYKVICHIPSLFSGSLVPLISSMKGQVLGFEQDDTARGWDIFKSLLPADRLQAFARSLRSGTQGIGYFEKTFDHFEEIYGKEAEQIVRKSVG